MTKDAFLTQLKVALEGLPKDEAENTLSFYREMVDDKIEEGLTEEEAVASVDTVEKIVAQVVGDTPLSKILIDKAKPKRKLQPWEILLLVLGSPIWLSLGIAAAAVLFSLWISLWAVLISVWSVFISMVGSAGGCAFGGIVLLCVGKVPEGLVALAIALVAGGLGIFLFTGCKQITKQCILLTKKLLLWIKTIFTRNRGESYE